MSVIIRNIKISIDKPDEFAILKAQKEFKTKKPMKVFKKSIDARKGIIQKVISVIFEDENEESFVKKCNNPDVFIKSAKKIEFSFGQKKMETRPIIIGFGPAGIMCAYILAKFGYKPVIFEMGFEIDTRDIHVDDFLKGGQFNKNSNIQFGEGGAGAYSDGKLTTRIKDPRSDEILEILHKFGAPEEVLYLAKPHIGTDILKNVVKNMRKEIIKLGGEVHFNKKLENILIKDGKLCEITVNGDKIQAEMMILAIGHSSRDTFEMLYEKNVFIEPKAFAIGARIEHLQKDINKSLYKIEHENLPIGEYNLANTVDGRGCFTFCMCPGGMVVPSNSEEETVVTNGMSYHARDLKNANSAVVVSVRPSDYGAENPLSGMYFQREIEKKAFNLSGDYKAPATLVSDFLNETRSKEFKTVVPSYALGTKFANFDEFLPKFVTDSMRHNLAVFGRKMSAFSNGDAVITGPETRTSSPIRITRNENLESINVSGLIPCGEGAGYAGGIMSAMVDGFKCAERIMKEFRGE